MGRSGTRVQGLSSAIIPTATVYQRLVPGPRPAAVPAFSCGIPPGGGSSVLPFRQKHGSLEGEVTSESHLQVGAAPGPLNNSQIKLLLCELGTANCLLWPLLCGKGGGGGGEYAVAGPVSTWGIGVTVKASVNQLPLQAPSPPDISVEPLEHSLIHKAQQPDQRAWQSPPVPAGKLGTTMPMSTALGEQSHPQELRPLPAQGSYQEPMASQ